MFKIKYFDYPSGTTDKKNVSNFFKLNFFSELKFFFSNKKLFLKTELFLFHGNIGGRIDG